LLEWDTGPAAGPWCSGLLSFHRWKRAVIAASLTPFLPLQVQWGPNFRLLSFHRWKRARCFCHFRSSEAQLSPVILPPLEAGTLFLPLQVQWGPNFRLLSFHRWKRAVFAALWNQPHAVSATSGPVRNKKTALSTKNMVTDCILQVKFVWKTSNLISLIQ